MASKQFREIALYYDELMQIVPYDFWAEYVMTLFEFVGHAPHYVLDCACGTGNLSFELAKLGLNVTGVDLSETMIEQALQKNESSQLPGKINFVQGNLCNFDLHQEFDSATCLYDSLNYILDNQSLKNAFGRIRSHLKPHGIFIFDFNSEWAFEANLFTQRSRKSTANPQSALHYNWQAAFDQKTRICTVQMHFQKEDENGDMKEFIEVHRERAYKISEIEAFLADTNWRLLHTFDAYTLNRPHSKSERWFFVATAE